MVDRNKKLAIQSMHYCRSGTTFIHKRGLKLLQISCEEPFGRLTECRSNACICGKQAYALIGGVIGGIVSNGNNSGAWVHVNGTPVEGFNKLASATARVKHCGYLAVFRRYCGRLLGEFHEISL